jgi:hypothetical protein
MPRQNSVAKTWRKAFHLAFDGLGHVHH